MLEDRSEFGHGGVCHQDKEKQQANAGEKSKDSRMRSLAQR